LLELRQIENTKDANIKPTPTATLANGTKGILEAKYLKLNKIKQRIKSNNF
jgi:hypothetical protein